MISLIVITIVSFCAAIIQTTGGFGFGPLFVPLVSLFVAYRYTTFISITACVCAQITIIIKYFKKIQWELVIVPTIASFITSYIGIHLIVGLSPKLINILLGCFLWILAIYLIFFASRVKLKRNMWTEISVGAIGGFTGGAFAVGGPPMVAYYDSVIDDPETYQATIQAFFFLASAAVIIEDLLCIHFTKTIGLLTMFAIFGCLVGTFVGTHILQKISMKTVRKIAYSVMLLAGTYDLIKGIFI